MNKPLLRTALIFAAIFFGFILVDLIIDHLAGNEIGFDLSNIVFSGLVVTTSIIILNQAMKAQKRSEAVLRQGRDELEIRIQERTAELVSMNETLQNEIAERKQAEQERARMEQALRASEETARALMNASSEAALLVDTSGIVLAANETAALRVNATVESIVGSPLFDHYPADVAEKRRNFMNQVLSGGQPARIEDQRDGKWFDFSICPILDTGEKIIRLAIFSQDITERKLAEQFIRASEERYRTLFDNFPEPTTVWDRNGLLLMQNLVSARNLGGQRPDYLGKTIDDIFGEAATAYRERMARVIDTGNSENQEDILELHFGRRYFWTFMQPIQNPDGQSVVQVISYDITDRKIVEEALRASEEKFATVFHSSPDAIGIIRVADGVLLDVNEAFTRMFGYGRSEIVGKTWDDLNLFPAIDAQNKVVEVFQQQGKLADYELDFTNREGNVVTMVMSLTLITISGEICVLAIGHDITRRKRSEEALLRAQAELALGIQERTALQERQRLSRELHDSVSQALYSISLGTHTALAVFDTDRAKALEALNYVLALSQAGLTEMRALIFELRPESLEIEGLVSALTKQTAALRARHGIKVELNLCEEPDAPLSVKEVLYRIAQEACQNAINHARSTQLDVRLKRETDRLALEICDNGVGFDALAVFPGHLGLRSMRERATSVGGNLEIISAPGCGTQIRVTIPVSIVQAVNTA